MKNRRCTVIALLLAQVLLMSCRDSMLPAGATGVEPEPPPSWRTHPGFTVSPTLTIVATGQRVQGGTVTDFQYSFNRDVLLTCLLLTFPGYDPVPDPDAPGYKSAGVTYHSDGWNIGGGQMPTGDHFLDFTGTVSGVPFQVRETVNIR